MKKEINYLNLLLLTISLSFTASCSDKIVPVTVSVGNTASNKLGFNYKPSVTITSITPTCFYNSTVTITGTNFSSVKEYNVVKFGNIAATVTAATSTSLTIKTPNLGVATTVDVTVTKAGITSNAKIINVDSDQNKVATYNWTTTTVKPGVTYKTGQFSLFGYLNEEYIFWMLLLTHPIH